MSSIAKRPDGSWRARYRDAAGREHSKHHARKVDAQRWLDEATAGIVTGQWVDPRGGRITFREYAETWRDSQVHRPSSAAHVETMLRRHAYPVLGDLPLSSIVPSKVQAWVKGMTLAPSTVGVVHGIVAGIFRAAVRDRRIATNPCEGTRLPKHQRARVEPLTLEQVVALADAAPPSWRAAVLLGAGAGLRNGEMLGLTLDRVDFLRRSLLVDQQLVTVQGREPFLGPPKTAASVRSVPSPASCWMSWPGTWSWSARTACSSLAPRAGRCDGQRSVRCGDRWSSAPDSRSARGITTSATTTRPCSSDTGRA